MTGRVLVDVEIDGKVRPAGTLHVSYGRRLTGTFTYAAEYLSARTSYQLDPQLPLRSGPSAVSGLPGAFQDASPDRWGRNLIRKRLVSGASSRGRAVHDLDFLLGVSDRTRQGALRFRLDEGEYLAPHTQVPQLMEMPQLLRAAEAVAADVEADADVKLLLDAGTGSLGGARPKASVADGSVLYIAKFPHPGDRWNVMAWEATALELAERCGVTVPRRSLVPVDRRPSCCCSVLIAGGPTGSAT